MVLPLLIIGAVVVFGGGYLITKTTNHSLDNLTSIFQSKQERNFELEESKKSAIVRDRGASANIYAWLFGEQALAESTKDKATQQKVLTGLEKNEIIDTGSYNSRRLGNTTRFNR